MNTRDMIDKAQQDEYDAHIDLSDFVTRADQMRKMAFEKGMKERNPAVPYRQKNVLSPFGRGLVRRVLRRRSLRVDGQRGPPGVRRRDRHQHRGADRPVAFLGPAYDEQMKAFYTTLEAKDLYKMKPIRGLFGESLADNSRLAAKVDEVLSPQVIREIVAAHQSGRRLYIGTTAAESKRFVIWDIGAIASRGCADDKRLIKQILLGSSGIPGVFPPQHINVDVDGQCVTERHVDGGVSQALFIHAPYVPPEQRSKIPNVDLAGTNLYLIVAGKLYADLEKVKPLALNLVGKEVSAMIYAQTRDDLQRIFTASMLTGMNYYMSSIPPEYPAPTSSMAFTIPALTGMFNEATDRVPGHGLAPHPAGRRSGREQQHPGGDQADLRGPRAGLGASDKGGAPFVPYPASGQGIPAVPIIK